MGSMCLPVAKTDSEVIKALMTRGEGATVNDYLNAPECFFNRVCWPCSQLKLGTSVFSSRASAADGHMGSLVGHIDVAAIGYW